MASYSVTINDSKSAAFLKFLKDLGGAKVVKNDEKSVAGIEIEEWHKKIVDARLKSVKNHSKKLVSEKEMNKRIKLHLKK